MRRILEATWDTPCDGGVLVPEQIGSLGGLRFIYRSGCSPVIH
jgi:hypothetical protein